MKKSKYIFLVVGIVLLIVLFKSFGVESTIEYILRIGWPGFFAICSIYIITNVTLAYGWRVLITYPIKAIHFYKFVLARIAGDATSSINALGSAAGEPLKAMYVKDILPLNIGLATVFLDRVIHIISSVLMVLTGIFASFFVFKSHLTENLILFISLLLLFVAMLFLIFKFFKNRSKGIIIGVVEKLPKRFKNQILTESNIKKINLIDDEINLALSNKNNLKHFYISLAMHYFGSIITCSFEIYLIVNYISPAGGINFLEGLFIYVFGFVATSALFFIPANVGTSEGSYSMALSLLGHDPIIGLSVGIIRRLRTFVWAGIGAVLLFYAGLIKSDTGA
ncbi:MAG: flippase-like domain-containing protein [Leptospirales bacterium]|nr:flippase-like domain-containing protein [Leptospirales bacterium]